MGRFFQGGGANLVTFSKWQAESQNGGQKGRSNEWYIILPVFTKHQDYSSSACHFEILPAFLRNAFLDTLNRLWKLLYCTEAPLVISLFQREEKAAALCIWGLHWKRPTNIFGQYSDISSGETTNMIKCEGPSKDPLCSVDKRLKTNSPSTRQASLTSSWYLPFPDIQKNCTGGLDLHWIYFPKNFSDEIGS